MSPDELTMNGNPASVAGLVVEAIVVVVVIGTVLVAPVVLVELSGMVEDAGEVVVIVGEEQAATSTKRKAPRFITKGYDRSSSANQGASMVT